MLYLTRRLFPWSKQTTTACLESTCKQGPTGTRLDWVLFTCLSFWRLLKMYKYPLDPQFWIALFFSSTPTLHTHLSYTALHYSLLHLIALHYTIRHKVVHIELPFRQTFPLNLKIQPIPLCLSNPTRLSGHRMPRLASWAPRYGTYIISFLRIVLLMHSLTGQVWQQPRVRQVCSGWGRQDARHEANRGQSCPGWTTEEVKFDMNRAMDES